MRNKPCFSTLLTSPLFLILIFLDLVFVFGQCQTNQQSILIQLKNTLQFDSSISTKLVSWNRNTNQDCCTWSGVTCRRSGEVTGLDLSNESISGGINDSSVLFNLKNLERLNLAANKFNFTGFPSRFGDLTNLVSLNLSNSDFSGQISGDLSKLTKLQVLDLSSLFSYGIRSLKLENPNLAMFVKNFTQLTELYLDNVNISAQKSDWCQALSSLTNLKVLSLSNCYLSGPIDKSLENLQNLSVIRLALNNLNSSVPTFFANFTNLTVLNLGSCRLNGTFPKKVLQLPSLETLDLSANTNLYGSLPEFPENGLLRSLLLSYTNFSGEIPESMGNLKMLSRLELFKSNFSGQIPQSMENLTGLSYLDLSSNNFSGEIPSFQLCKNLTHIDLSRNRLSGKIPSAHFRDLQNLESIDLRLNQFDGNIPSSLFDLPLLQRIQLSNNNFNGRLINFSNQSFSLLNTIDLSSNKLEGEIPSSFFELKKLSILLLSSNNLTGAIKTEVFRGLTNLTSLDLSYNNLSIEATGKISGKSPFPQLSSLKLSSCNLERFPDLTNQSSLVTLDLSDNKIGGEIPRWIWNSGNGRLSYMNLSFNRFIGLEEPYIFPNLSIIDLHSNQLTGVIPVPPKTAAYIDYSNNLFSSSIPNTIGDNLFVAYFFSVSNNTLTGQIPNTICDANYLQVLDLSNNHLSGTIPRCLIEFAGALGVLNLAKNNLSGSIEGTFLKTCGLNTLDLHKNRLSGTIPPSLANCTMLEVLNLGNNMFFDTYPCSLRNNTNLRVLVLRSNNLHGGVRCGEPVINAWQKLQILDISFNNFTGEVPPDCFWNWNAMISDEYGSHSGKSHLRFPFLQLNEFSYQDTVRVTIKGLDLELVKILTIFTSIDISSNNFMGEIPTTIGRLKALYLLNVSNNEFKGSIPRSIGNLSELESLDLSSNKLTGDIPWELTNLRFLTVLNLSYNQLEGRIPTGPQFQTFPNNSYEGNMGLCGFPLNNSCNRSIVPKPDSKSKKSKNDFDWQFIITGVGFGSGAAIVIGPIVFSKKGREFWEKYTDKLYEIICLAFGIRYTSYEMLFYEEKYVENGTGDGVESECEFDDAEFKGKYCVFCTKLDFSRRKAIHDAKCTCFESITPELSCSTSSCSSAVESPFSKL